MFILRHKLTQRRLFFDGDSITAGSGSFVNAQYMSIRCASELRAQGKKFAVFNYAVAGTGIPIMNTRLDSWISMIQPGDIVHVSCGTNNAYFSGHDAATMYANLCIYIQRILDAGGLVVSGTMIARGTLGVDDAKELIRLQYNTLQKGGSICPFTIADWGGDTNFDSLSKTTNGVYYQSDFIHPTFTTGNDYLADNYSVPAIASLW